MALAGGGRAGADAWRLASAVLGDMARQRHASCRPPPIRTHSNEGGPAISPRIRRQGSRRAPEIEARRPRHPPSLPNPPPTTSGEGLSRAIRRVAPMRRSTRLHKGWRTRPHRRLSAGRQAYRCIVGAAARPRRPQAEAGRSTGGRDLGHNAALAVFDPRRAPWMEKKMRMLFLGAGGTRRLFRRPRGASRRGRDLSGARSPRGGPARTRAAPAQSARRRHDAARIVTASDLRRPLRRYRARRARPMTWAAP